MKKLLALALLASCSATPVPETRARAEGAPPTMPAEMEQPDAASNDFVLVWLRTGPVTDLAPDERTAAYEGHFSNMDRLYAERQLVIAGPFGETKAEPDLRGIYVFDVTSADEAQELARTDPAVQAGVFVFDALPLRTETPLRRLYALDAELDKTDESMRYYVVATAKDADAADEALSPFVEEGLVPITGRLGGERAGEGLYVLLAESVDEARDILAAASGEADLGWSLSHWYGTRSIARLPE